MKLLADLNMSKSSQFRVVIIPTGNDFFWSQFLCLFKFIGIIFCGVMYGEKGPIWGNFGYFLFCLFLGEFRAWDVFSISSSNHESNIKQTKRQIGLNWVLFWWRACRAVSAGCAFIWYHAEHSDNHFASIDHDTLYTFIYDLVLTGHSKCILMILPLSNTYYVCNYNLAILFWSAIITSGFLIFSFLPFQYVLSLIRKKFPNYLAA